MAQGQSGGQSISSADFAESSVIDVIIPDASEIDLEDALKSSEGENEGDEASLVPAIVQRHRLFLGRLDGLQQYSSSVLLIADMQMN